MKRTGSLLVAMMLVSGVALAQDPDTSATASPQSAEPIADGTSQFNHLDVDRDGWLTPSEVKVYPQPLPEFALMDEDADGKLSSAEWNARVELVEYEEED